MGCTDARLPQYAHLCAFWASSTGSSCNLKCQFGCASCDRWWPAARRCRNRPFHLHLLRSCSAAFVFPAGDLIIAVVWHDASQYYLQSCCREVGPGTELQKARSERVECSFAHMYETSGMRRTHLRKTNNILKQLLIHAVASKVALMIRAKRGMGKPRTLQGLQDRLCCAQIILLALSEAERPAEDRSEVFEADVRLCRIDHRQKDAAVTTLEKSVFYHWQLVKESKCSAIIRRSIRQLKPVLCARSDETLAARGHNWWFSGSLLVCWTQRVLKSRPEPQRRCIGKHSAAIRMWPLRRHASRTGFPFH